MKKLLLIMGDLATGKSAFSDILSKRYDVTVFKKDSIKEVLGDTIGFSNREENLKLSAVTMELMLLIFSEFTKLNKDLILESNFSKADLERLYKAAAENDYEVLVLMLRGDIAVLHKRYLNRMYNENRHPVHLSAALDIFDNFQKYIESARKEEITGNVIQIDANDFSYQADQELLKKIDEFMRREIL